MKMTPKGLSSKIISIQRMYKGDLAATDASKSRCVGCFLSGQKLGGPGLLIVCPPTGVSKKARQWFSSCWDRSAVKIPNAKVSGPEIVRTKNRTSGSHREGLTQVDHTQLQLLLRVWSCLPGIYRSCSFGLPKLPLPTLQPSLNHCHLSGERVPDSDHRQS